MNLALLRNAIFSFKSFKNMILKFRRKRRFRVFMTVAAYFHRMISAQDQSKPFSSEDAIQIFYRLLVQVGIEADVPPLPRSAVEQWIAALRWQTVGNVTFQQHSIKKVLGSCLKSWQHSIQESRTYLEVDWKVGNIASRTYLEVDWKVGNIASRTYM